MTKLAFNTLFMDAYWRSLPNSPRSNLLADATGPTSNGSNCTSIKILEVIMWSCDMLTCISQLLTDSALKLYRIWENWSMSITFPGTDSVGESTNLSWSIVLGTSCYNDNITDMMEMMTQSAGVTVIYIKKRLHFCFLHRVRYKRGTPALHHPVKPRLNSVRLSLWHRREHYHTQSMFRDHWNIWLVLGTHPFTVDVNVTTSAIL